LNGVQGAGLPRKRRFSRPRHFRQKTNFLAGKTGPPPSGNSPAEATLGRKQAFFAPLDSGRVLRRGALSGQPRPDLSPAGRTPRRAATAARASPAGARSSRS
jgi:hypothetical protein